MKPNITELIVEHDLCIGCGVCSGLCPVNVLPMEFNTIGEYVPQEIEGCLDKCTFCIDVCPFVDTNDNEDLLAQKRYAHHTNSHHTKETGYYLNAYVAHNAIEPERLKGASGGVSSWLLKTLYEEGLVDSIVCISNEKDSEKLFDYRVHNELSFLEKNPGSVYYPVELSGAIKHILKHPGNYVITGLPCFIKAIRLAQKRNRKLRERVKYTLALTCGQMKSKYYTEHLSRLAGTEGEIEKVHYRGKDERYTSSNFYFSSSNGSGVNNRLYWREGPKNIWTNRCYTPTACNYCDDVFGETADISVMDAWLSEYVNEYKGNSLIVTRDPQIEQLIQKALLKKQLKGSVISIDKIIKSQQGVLTIKREHLSYRLHLAQHEGIKTPKKRVNPSDTLSWFTRKEIELKYQIQNKSKELLADHHKVDIAKFDETINPLVKKIENLRMVYRKVNLFQRVFAKLLRRKV